MSMPFPQFLPLFLGLFAFFPSLAFAAPSSPQALIEDAYTAIQKATDLAQSQDELIEQVTPLLNDLIDYEAFSERTLKKTWPSLSGLEKESFISSFKSLISSTYAKKFSPKTQFSVSYRDKSELSDTLTLIKSTVKSKKVAADVDYLISTEAENKSPKVIDITIDEVSMALNWRRQFERIVEKDGFPALIEKIDERSGKN